MIIFDFDKTLINKDTLFDYYKFVHRSNMLFNLKRIFLVLSALLYKIGLINNDKLKSIGIFLFLKGRHKSDLEKVSEKYAQTLKLNNIYEDVFLRTPKEKRVIISASPEIYLKKVFPDENVIGTLFCYKNNKVKGLKINCYGKTKLDRLKCQLPDLQIEEVYSDSISDRPLFNNSNRNFIIRKGKIFDFAKSNIL